MSDKKILFVSYHSLFDPSSGASLSASHLLELLSTNGWAVRALSGPLFDSSAQNDLPRFFHDQGIPFQVKKLHHDDCFFELYGYKKNAVNGAVFWPSSKHHQPGPNTSEAFLTTCSDMIDRWKPDILLTYGGQTFMSRLFRHARKRNVRTIFWLRNFAYKNSRFFADVDSVIVPSAFAANHYSGLGIAAKAIAPLIDRSTLSLGEHHDEKKFVTFINPEPQKGLFVFARIAHILGHERPDIPMLVVESRQKSDALFKTGLDFSGLTNISFMQHTPDPREFYKRTAITIMPSLWWESFGRVAAESMMNGIPVLASDRGALPEVCGNAGFLFHIPERYTPRTRVPISVQEARPWADTIIRLWDEPDFYRKHSEACRLQSDQWNVETLLKEYLAFFDSFLRKPAGRTSGNFC